MRFWILRTTFACLLCDSVVLAGEVIPSPKAPPGVVWIAGGEFSMEAEPNEKRRVQRGSSFLCNAQYRSRYIVGTRGKGDVNTGTNHPGFRCVLSVAEQPRP